MTDSDHSESGTDQSICPACGLEADEMGVLDSGDRVYIHGSSYCYARLEDEHGLLAPAVDQIRAHKGADGGSADE
jgi:hypothetical protein